MDQETRITYSVIAVLIIILAGLAFFLQPQGVNEITPPQENKLQQKQPSPAPTKITTSTTTATTMENTENKNFTTAIITTNKGVIEFAFDTNTPMTKENFGKLATSHFYDGVRFHRVIKGFMIQAGDPLSKDPSKVAQWGTGGPGYRFNDELTGREQYPQGTVAMANAGPNTNGSQFFIVTAAPSVPLPPNYTVFGHVTKGMDVALAIENVKTTTPDRPVDDVVIEKVEVK